MTVSTPGRRPKSYSQADRLSRMMRALASRALTVRDLADEFGITRRQVYRDLQHIETQGHPLTQQGDAGERTWQLPLGYKGLPPITVSPYELLSLHVARAHVSYLEGTPFLDDLDAILDKIHAGLPDRTTNHLTRIVHAAVYIGRPTRSYGQHRSIIQVVRRALLFQRTVKLEHRSPSHDHAVPHLVDPYILLLYQHGLYILGRSHRAQAMRLFAVERIVEATVTDDTFDIPTTFPMQSVEKKLFGLIDEAPQDVCIEFSQEVGYLLKERQWHPTQKLSPGKRDKVQVTFHAGGQEELATWVLSWGSRAKVLRPPALAEAVKKELASALKQYHTS